MLEIPLSQDDEELLREAEKASTLHRDDIILAAIRTTLRYFQVHGCLSFVTTELRDCHGCRFLNRPECNCHSHEAANIIPFRA